MYCEKERQKKCKEIKKHISKLEKLYYENVSFWSKGWEDGDDWKSVLPPNEVKKNICYYRQELMKYSGWFSWWKYTSMNDIINEKGDCKYW